MKDFGSFLNRDLSYFKHFKIPNYLYRLEFPTGRDSATFRDKGTEVPSLSRTKGQRDKLKILPRDGTAKIWDGMRDKTGQSRKGHFKTGKRCSKTENVVLKKENDVQKQENVVQKQEIL